MAQRSGDTGIAAFGDKSFNVVAMSVGGAEAKRNGV
jgi:hypothetical protein